VGVIQFIRARVPPPVIVSMSQGDTTSAQVGQTYTPNTPAVTGGQAPLSFSGSFFPAGFSVNPATGTITGSPTGGGDYYGANAGVLLNVSDALARNSSRALNIVVYTARELGFEPGAPRTYNGTAGTRGIFFNDQNANTTPICHRINNGTFQNPIQWWGPLFGGFPGYSQFEAFAFIVSGTAGGGSSAFNTWLNISTSPAFYLSTAGTIAIELRPVGGSSVGAANFTFNT
jgi:hypothetical protein